jgi:hypothetical protein
LEKLNKVVLTKIPVVKAFGAVCHQRFKESGIRWETAPGADLPSLRYTLKEDFSQKVEFL